MSGELVLAISCGAVLVVTGIIAYVWTLRSYSGRAREPEHAELDAVE